MRAARGLVNSEAKACRARLAEMRVYEFPVIAVVQFRATGDRMPNRPED
jgi:hypothetical protein